MAQHYWTAEDYAVGDVPSEWAITNATIEIAEDSNGSKYLDVTAPDENRSFLEYTPAPAAEDGEVWMRFQTGPSGDIWAFLRGQGLDSPGNVSMTRTDYMAENGFDRLGEFSNGSYGAIDDKPITTPAGSIGQLRGSFDGDTLQGRWWDDGTAEPASWGLAGTTSVTGQGVAGVGHWRGSDVRIYEFGVGVGGDPAPSGITTRTRTIGGTFVDDSGTPQSGAAITVLNDDNYPPTVLGTATTGSEGNWSLDVTPGTTVHCLAEWEDGDGTQYQSESKPFIADETLPYEDGLVVHFDAAALGETHGYSDGDTVDLWPDESGNGHDAVEINSGENPVYQASSHNGHGVLHFDETTWLSTTFDSAISQPLTQFTVWELNSEGTEEFVYAFDSLADNTNRITHYYHASSDVLRFSAGATSWFNVDITRPFSLLTTSGVFENGSVTRYVDGELDGSSDAGTNGMDGMTIGGRFNEPRLHGQIAEIVSYDHALSDSDRQAVENYLLTKWGLPN